MTSELLAVSDLPAGWSSVPSSDSTSSTPQCFQNVKTDLKPTSKAEATFQGGSSGLPLLDESLGYLPGRGQQAIALISQVLSRCGQISLTSDGATITGTIGAMSFPAVGDQSSAWQINLTGTESGISLTVGIDFIVFRKGDTLALIFYGDLGTPDIQTVEHLVQVAASKLP